MNIPAIKDILDGTAAPLPDDNPSVMYAVMNALSFEVNECFKNNEAEVFTYTINTSIKYAMDNFTPEFCLYFIKSILTVDKEGNSSFNLRTTLTTENKTRFHKQLLPLLQDVGDGDGVLNEMWARVETFGTAE